jgi:hypothetical protein
LLVTESGLGSGKNMDTLRVVGSGLTRVKEMLSLLVAGSGLGRRFEHLQYEENYVICMDFTVLGYHSY